MGVLLSGFIRAVLDSFRGLSHSFLFFTSTYIFLKESVKGDYTKSYKILVTQDSYRVLSVFFSNSLQSHVVTRAQRAPQISYKISRHLIAFTEGVYILLKKGVKGDYTKSYKIPVTQDSYRIV